MTITALEALRRAAETVRSAEAQLQYATSVRDSMIRDLVAETQFTQAEIAGAADMSDARVRQLVRGGERAANSNGAQ